MAGVTNPQQAVGGGVAANSQQVVGGVTQQHLTRLEKLAAKILDSSNERIFADRSGLHPQFSTLKKDAIYIVFRLNNSNKSKANSSEECVVGSPAAFMEKLAKGDGKKTVTAASEGEELETNDGFSTYFEQASDSKQRAIYENFHCDIEF